MRSRIIVGLVSLAALAAGCSSNDTSSNASGNGSLNEAAKLYTIIASPVTGNRAEGINGSFQIVEAADGIPSDRSGGACILFRAQDLGYADIAHKSCNNDSQCQAPGASGYCGPDHGCWARPAAPPAHDPLCKRSIDFTPPKLWNVDDVNMIGSNAIPVPANLKPNAQAVVLACLRGAGSPGASPASPASTACGQPHSVGKWGTATPIP